MLEPQTRKLLFEALRPPTGMRLEGALGTSFSLDLLALLTAPMAFTQFECQDAERGLITEPLSIFEALRRNIDRIAIFCQAGRIRVYAETDDPARPDLLGQITPGAPAAEAMVDATRYLAASAGRPVVFRFEADDPRGGRGAFKAENVELRIFDARH